MREELKKQLRAFDLKPNDGCEGVTLQQMLQEFDKYFLDYQNEIFASFKFLEIKQEQGEKFTDYYSRLRARNAVVECNYGESQGRMLRDKLIQGLLDKALQERLIRETSKKARTLQEVASECKTAENSKVQASVMNEKLTVNALKNFKNYRKQRASIIRKISSTTSNVGKNIRRNVRHSELNVKIVTEEITGQRCAEPKVNRKTLLLEE
ncbi:reverse transcriptase domain-containing protein [Trichonephila inaurata madagascariensis]|uniref:Reverse transcriptase domain-containing protein n=1 Tax=Trichonephila inaurata madagascariensis TaxID=2747483 RepID=A0A8X6X9M8_9ARAC|nr:reverse transcriptase domain-containing protein [Trichonephila inaurata madagascariensis]